MDRPWDRGKQLTVDRQPEPEAVRKPEQAEATWQHQGQEQPGPEAAQEQH